MAAADSDQQRADRGGTLAVIGHRSVSGTIEHCSIAVRFRLVTRENA